MVEQGYEAESVLQQLLADYPNLLAGDADFEPRRRWLLVKRELGIASQEDGGNRWSIDHLFLDQDGVPTLVEVKRASDTRIRREVLGQLLDYAANASVSWGLTKIREAFESRLASLEEAEAVVDDFLDGYETPERFWESVGVNLSPHEMARLASLIREVPGVRPHFEDLEERNYGSLGGMPPGDALDSDESLETFKRAVLEAAQRDPAQAARRG